MILFAKCVRRFRLLKAVKTSIASTNRFCSISFDKKRFVLCGKWNANSRNLLILTTSSCSTQQHWISTKQTTATVDRKQKSVTSSAIKKLLDRSFLHSTFPGTLATTLDETLRDTKPCVYAGFDPTADSLHIGNLLVIITLLHLYSAGYKVIAVIGDATARLGDPTGRSTDRPVLSKEEISRNASFIGPQIDSIFRNYTEYFHKGSGKSSGELIILNNADWVQNLKAVDFLSSVSRPFRVGKMMKQNAIKNRINEDNVGIAFPEFAYQILQSYDWLHLYEKYGCRFQVGGADQTFNVEAGHDLVKHRHQVDTYGLFVPIITSETGSKFGKSAGDNVWLSANRTSPFSLYQYFARLPDTQARSLLRYFSFIPTAELDRFLAKAEGDPGLRLPQLALADTVTALVHSMKGLEAARTCTRALYGGSVDAIGELSSQELNDIAQHVPCVTLQYRPDVTFLELGVLSGCFKNERNGERVIKEGGFYINNVRFQETQAIVVPGTHILLGNNVTLLRTGKRHYVLVKWDGLFDNAHDTVTNKKFY